MLTKMDKKEDDLSSLKEYFESQFFSTMLKEAIPLILRVKD